MAEVDEASKGVEGQKFEAGTDEKVSVGLEPVEIKVAVGDKVKIKGTVVAIDGEAVTIEIDDGLENNIHRITLNSNQTAAAVVTR